MNSSFPVRTTYILAAFTLVWLWVSTAGATVVRIVTSLGNIDLRLYEGHSPLTVANFLNYADSNRYDGTFIHRSMPGFVIQGGGYTYNAETQMAPHIPQFDQIVNEPGISNLRGTIAMAKLPPPPEGPENGGPDSATSEWFLNLSDSNAANLDFQNGGFTVFGRIVFTGTATMNAIAALTRYDLDPFPQDAFDNVPLQPDIEMVKPLKDRLVYVTDVFIRTAIPAADYDIDADVDLNDYNVWKSTLGSTTDARADGNGNGIVDAADYVMWRKAFGPTGASVVGIVPEASTAILLLLAAIHISLLRLRRSA